MKAEPLRSKLRGVYGGGEDCSQQGGRGPAEQRSDSFGVSANTVGETKREYTIKNKIKRPPYNALK